MVPDVATPIALWRDWLRLVAVDESQQWLEAIHTLLGVGGHRKDLTVVGKICAVLVEQRQQLGRAILSHVVCNVSTDSLTSNKLLIKLHKGRHQDFGTYVLVPFASKALHRWCGACKKTDRTDSSHGSLELNGFFHEQPFRTQ